MAKLYVVGIGPGGKEHLTIKAIETIRQCSVIVGYTYYIELVRDLIEDQKIIQTGMTKEIERCRAAISEVQTGNDTCIISTGDPGLYGMAGPIMEMIEDVDVDIVPGVSSVFSAAAEMGSPLMHDFCTISLSDLLTPWSVIEKRLEHAAKGDFVISLYNPKSRGRKEHINRAVDILSQEIDPKTPVALVKNAGRDGNEKKLLTLGTIDFEFVDMKTVVIIGNSQTYTRDGWMITPRGYKI
ncbi:MAG: precorrin-3B C(17)-methyltransferase [Proteobacteria bacterium]|nr:precorrin-3B C(17)-methyltransferase [Pseudomonadota bacterium]